MREKQLEDDLIPYNDTIEIDQSLKREKRLLKRCLRDDLVDEMVSGLRRISDILADKDDPIRPWTKQVELRRIVIDMLDGILYVK